MELTIYNMSDKFLTDLESQMTGFGFGKYMAIRRQERGTYKVTIKTYDDAYFKIESRGYTFRFRFVLGNKIVEVNFKSNDFTTMEVM